MSTLDEVAFEGMELRTKVNEFAEANEQLREQLLETEKRLFRERDQTRAERHHDVLCLVLKGIVKAWVSVGGDLNSEASVAQARKLADLAYPPPKALCALVGCEKTEPHDHPVSGPYCTPPKAEAK